MKWFRMYHSVVDSVKVRGLPERAQLAYIYLLCVASEYRERSNDNSGATGLDVSRAAWRLREPMLGRYLPLIEGVGLTVRDDAGLIFISDWQDKQKSSDDAASRQRLSRDRSRQCRVLDTDTDTDTDTDKPIPNANALGVAGTPATPRRTLPDCPHQKLVAIYRECLPINPGVVEWAGSRVDHMRARWRKWWEDERYTTEDEGLAYWRRYFLHVGKSKFLTGQTDGRDGKTPFIADLEWLVKPSNVRKVVEGKYHGAQT